MRKLAPAIICLLFLAVGSQAQTITYESGGSGGAYAYAATVSVTGRSWTAGWLVVVSSTIKATDAAISDSNGNTWTACNSYSDPTANHYGNQWWAIVASGKGGSGISVTVTTGTTGNLYLNVIAFQSSTGWQASPVDQAAPSAVTNYGYSETTTASSQNAGAIELNIGRGLVSAANIGSVTYTSGYTGPVAEDSDTAGAVWYKITSTKETASFGITDATECAVEVMLTTFKPAQAATTMVRRGRASSWQSW